MTVKKLTIKNFRNIKSMTLCPHDKYNLIYGKNAQGKTSVLEALWMLSGCKSFRASKEVSAVNHGAEMFELEMECFDERDYTVSFKSDGVCRDIFINKVKSDKQTLFDSFKCILFTPADVELIRGSPEKRRDFIDLCNSQLFSGYSKTVRELRKLLKQRNTAIRQINFGNGSSEVLASFNAGYAYACVQTVLRRGDYIQSLDKLAGRVYNEISGGSERLRIEYVPSRTAYSPELKTAAGNTAACEELYAYLCSPAARRDELNAGYTVVGPHKDDIRITVDGFSSREFASQGQQKSAALSLKLAQAYICRKMNNARPVVLLDDVMGELDSFRRNVVYNIVRDMQVFITSCNRDAFKHSELMKEFEIGAGDILSG
ncbi:MAG: DNA replication and repair protein RecF, partial [Oscillospiraceae bacterium]|nr:DNA replication and repair protein RecF [Oscillospiraceae bacterium]